MSFSFLARPTRQRGIALVAVLWIVAALSIVVTSMGYSVRHELRVISSSREAVIGNATGQAAIHIVLQDLVPRHARAPTQTFIDTRFRDLAIRVRVVPLSGLIDINNASPALLGALFAVAGQVSTDRAAALAAAVIEVRSVLDKRGKPVGFEAREDLMRVPGIDYPLYAKISALVTADVQGTGRVAPLAAPEGVLLVLAAGNVARAAGIAVDRARGQPGIDTTSLNGEFTDTGGSSPRYELEARVPLPSGSWLLVSRTVDFGATGNGLPWRTINTAYRFEPPGEPT